MQCLELKLPPLPQLITVGHAVWPESTQHARRSFAVYDLIFVKRGTIYMAEDDRRYELSGQHMLTLEPGRTHWGYRPCDDRAEMYWVHFLHPAPLRTLERDDIPWSTMLRSGTDRDLEPPEQYMYVPKFARIDLAPLEPIFEQMCRLHRALTVGGALQLQSLLAQLLDRLQSAARPQPLSRSSALCGAIIDYLHAHMEQPFSSAELERELHFQFDYLARCLKKHTGLSPLQYLQRIRIEKARSLLEQTEQSVQSIAEQVGIPSYSYFNRLFQSMTGVTPGRYRALRGKG